MFRRTKRSGAVDDSWTVSETTYNGRRLIVRANVGARHLAGHKRFGIKVGVAIPLNALQDDGMPSNEEAEQLNTVEDQLVAGLDGHAHLVLVLTTVGMREFVAYTGDGGWLPAFDQDLQTAVTTHEVQIDARTDPQWAAYRAFVD